MKANYTEQLVSSIHIRFERLSVQNFFPVFPSQQKITGNSMNESKFSFYILNFFLVFMVLTCTSSFTSIRYKVLDELSQYFNCECFEKQETSEEVFKRKENLSLQEGKMSIQLTVLRKPEIEKKISIFRK